MGQDGTVETAMDATRQYDKELQMFRDPIREPDPAKLRFLRWLAEQARLEHRVFGKPAGEYESVLNN
jgi:hypothetical protein